MTDDQELAKRLRNYAACEVKVSIGEHEDICSQAADAIERLSVQCRRYEARLEIDFIWRVTNVETGEMIKVEIPIEERAMQIDGIECRDETIKLQDTAIDAEKLRHAMLFDELTQAKAERDAAYLTGALAMQEACVAEIAKIDDWYTSLRHQDDASITGVLIKAEDAIRAIDPASIRP